MSDVKISALPAVTSVATTDVIPVVTGGVTSKIGSANFVNSGLSGGTANGVLYLNGSKAATSGSALTFDGTNLGIGTSSPSAKLNVTSTSAGATVELIRLSNPGAGANTQAQIKFFTTSTNYGTISGGYGAAAPQMTFDLPSASPGNYVWQITSSEKMRLSTDGTFRVKGAGTAGSTDAVQFSGSAPANSLLLDSSGNLGIGTSSPSAKLHTAGSAGGVQALFAYTSGTPTIAIGNSTTNYNLQVGYNVSSEYGYIQATAAAGVYDDIAINPNGGNVGIGTASPGAKLHIVGLSSNNQLFLERTGSATSKWSIYAQSNSLFFNDQVAGADRMIIDASGNLGIGTTANASAILDAQSTTKGVRFPNMTTTQKNAIASPAAGLVVFDTTLAKLCVYTGAAWQTITSV